MKDYIKHFLLNLQEGNSNDDDLEILHDYLLSNKSPSSLNRIFQKTWNSTSTCPASENYQDSIWKRIEEEIKREDEKNIQ